MRRPGRRRPAPTTRLLQPVSASYSCEAEVVPGLEEFARAEIAARLAGRVDLGQVSKPGNVPFDFSGDLGDLLSLGTVGSVYLVRRFAVPRPLALLGHQNFEALVGLIEEVRQLHPPAAFKTFRVSAAGEGSPAFERLRGAIRERTSLVPAAPEADLLLRVRRPLGGGEGFEVSVRLSPRPLSARPWRVRDMPGALNATVARVMARLSRPKPDDSFLNLACGSGTILIERLAEGRARSAVGTDTDPAALECARANVEAAGLSRRVRLEGWDAGDLPLPDRSISALCADLPFGHLVGSHAENERLYPRALSDGARVARPGARFVVITSEARLFERVAAAQADRWTAEQSIPLDLDGTRLRIYVLIRKA